MNYVLAWYTKVTLHYSMYRLGHGDECVVWLK